MSALQKIWISPVNRSLFRLGYGVQNCLTRHFTVLAFHRQHVYNRNHIAMMFLNNQSSPCKLHLCARDYAKKNKKDKKGKSVSAKVDLSDEEIGGVVNMEAYRSALQQTIDHQKQEYTKHLTLRTTAGVFDSIMADTEDGPFPINQLGQIAQKSAHLVMINLSASPQYIPAVKEAIIKSGMNVNPQQEANTLFVPIPKVTKEHRENLAKSAKTICDTTKDKLRDIHNKHAKKVRQAKSSHSEDLLKDVQNLILNEMHSSSDKAEIMMKAKQQELLGH